MRCWLQAAGCRLPTSERRAAFVGALLLPNKARSCCGSIDSVQYGGALTVRKTDEQAACSVRHSSGKHQMTIRFCSAALLLARKSRLLLAATAPGSLSLSRCCCCFDYSTGRAAFFLLPPQSQSQRPMVRWLAFSSHHERAISTASGFVGNEIMKKTVARKVKIVEILSDLSSPGAAVMYAFSHENQSC